MIIIIINIKKIWISADAAIIYESHFDYKIEDHILHKLNYQNKFRQIIVYKLVVVDSIDYVMNELLTISRENYKILEEDKMVSILIIIVYNIDVSFKYNFIFVENRKFLPYFSSKKINDKESYFVDETEDATALS